MRLRELIVEGPIQTIGRAVGKTAHAVGKTAGVGNALTAKAADPSAMVQGAGKAQQHIQQIKNIAKGNFGSIGSGSSAADTAASDTPFDQLSNQDAKAILGNILNGKPLDQYQTSQLRKVYDKL